MNRLRAPISAGIVCLVLAMSLMIASSSSAAFLVFVELQKDGANGVDGLNFVRSVVVSLDGKHIYAASWLDNAVAAFSRNTMTGGLSFVEVKKDGVGGVDGLASARSVALSPDDKHIYVAGETDNAIAAFSRNATTGGLSFVEVKKDGVGGVDGLAGARSVTLSPDGKHVYAASANDNAIAAFSRNATTGALTFVEVKKDGVGGIDGLAGARTVTVSPDGKHVYAAGENDNAIAVFSRNATTGALTFVEVQKDGVGGIDGLAFAQSVTVSPDNKHAYATGISSVVVFSRNATTGSLTFVEVKRNGSGGDGLSGSYWVTVSPDGAHVYVIGGLDDALAVFSRNATTGALTFVEAQKNGIGGVQGLDFVQAVAVSPDNANVYTGSGVDNAVAVFRAGGAPPPTATSTSTTTPQATPDRRLGYLPIVRKPTLPSPTPTLTPRPGTPTATPPPASQLDGTWKGTTAQGREISFTIINRGLKSIDTSYKVGGCTAFAFTTFNSPQPITGNTFRALQLGPYGETIETNGTFASNTTASGTLKLFSSPCGSFDTTWTATKQ